MLASNSLIMSQAHTVSYPPSGSYPESSKTVAESSPPNSSLFMFLIHLARAVQNGAESYG